MGRAWILTVLFLAPCRAALAGDASSKLGGLEWHGFAQVNYAARLCTTRQEKPPSGDFLLGEERLQLQLSGSAPKGGVGYFSEAGFLLDEGVRPAEGGDGAAD